MHGTRVMVYQWPPKSISVMHGIRVKVYQLRFLFVCFLCELKHFNIYGTEESAEIFRKSVPIPNKRTRFSPVDKNIKSYPVFNKRTPLLLVKFLNIEPPGTTQINHC